MSTDSTQSIEERKRLRVGGTERHSYNNAVLVVNSEKGNC